jgi:hypothetical protein
MELSWLLEVGEDLQYGAGCWWGAGGQARGDHCAHRRRQLSGMVQHAPIYPDHANKCR